MLIGYGIQSYRDIKNTTLVGLGDDFQVSFEQGYSVFYVLDTDSRNSIQQRYIKPNSVVFHSNEK